MTATLVGPGGESEPSPVVTYVLDISKPKMTVTEPADGATVNAETATITGKTQGKSVVVARNEANGTSATARADPTTGSFTLEVTLQRGTNGIALTATDLAGNVGTAVLTVLRGSGSLEVGLSASAYRISAARLPRTIEPHRPGHEPGWQRPLRRAGHLHALDPRRAGHHRRRPDRRIGDLDLPDDRSRPERRWAAAWPRRSSSTVDFGEASAQISITIIE